jgi:hypothetical protein
MDLAAWVVRHQRRGGQAPIDITLVKRVTDIPPPGTSGPAPHPVESQVFTTRVTPEMLKSSGR